VIAGGASNTVTGHNSGVVTGEENTVVGHHAAIVAGKENEAHGDESAVVAGHENINHGDKSVIGAGHKNKIHQSKEAGIVAGFQNEIVDDSERSFIGAGNMNVVSSPNGAVLAGASNTVSNENGFVGAGTSNTASGVNSMVGAGEFNTASNLNSFVGGGQTNSASGSNGAVVAGRDNTASGSEAMVGAGTSNTASGGKAAVMAGHSNKATGENSFVGAGFFNQAGGKNAATLAGRHNIANGANSIGVGSYTRANKENQVVIAAVPQDNKQYTTRSTPVTPGSQYTHPTCGDNNDADSNMCNSGMAWSEQGGICENEAKANSVTFCAPEGIHLNGIDLVPTMEFLQKQITDLQLQLAYLKATSGAIQGNCIRRCGRVGTSREHAVVYARPSSDFPLAYPDTPYTPRAFGPYQYGVELAGQVNRESVETQKTGDDEEKQFGFYRPPNRPPVPFMPWGTWGTSLMGFSPPVPTQIPYRPLPPVYVVPPPPPLLTPVAGIFACSCDKACVRFYDCCPDVEKECWAN